MRLNFRKISALASSALMLGMTAGIAAAANYPAPFVSGGSANVAIVYGSGAAFSDQTAAQSISTSLSGFVSGVSVEGGEPFPLDKDSNHFNFGNALNAVYTSLDSDEMAFLADGEYDDGDVDETFEQSITLSSTALSLFADTDYADKAPTVGFQWTNGQNILNYTMTFDDPVNTTQMVATDMPLLGRTYYVLAASNTQIDVLDTAEKLTWTVGQSDSVGGHSVTLDFVDSDSAKFTVDGNSLDVNEGDYKKVPGTDSYLVVTDVSYQDYAGGIQSAEFSIGSGKIELISGEEAELNTEDIDGLEVLISNSSAGHIDSIKLIWNSDRDTFLTESSSIALPEFGVISLAFGGLVTPSAETINIDSSSTLTLDMGNYDLDIMWFDDAVAPSAQALGEDGNLLKLAATSYTYADLGFANGSSVWWFNSTRPVPEDIHVTLGEDAVVSGAALNLSENERFLVTRVDDDLTDVETLYYEVASIDIDDTDTWTVELDDLIGSNDLTFTNARNDTDDHGDVTVNVAGFASTNLSVVLDFSAASGTITYNKAVSEKGLVVTIPTDLPNASTAGFVTTGNQLSFREPDKDGEGGVDLGMVFNVTITNSTDDVFHVSGHNVTTQEESSDVDIGYVTSDLATMIRYDTTDSDAHDFTMTFYGTEVTADVQVVAGGTVSTTGGSLGDVLVTDAEVSTVNTKNLVVVGGSCINTAAASLLGVSANTCESAWTTATGVGSGQFLIKGYASSSLTSRMALLVAGYEAADTTNAATYLRTQTVDTSASYIGTSGTSATLQVA
jgi:hypothetical protein